ncbi:SET and MYND domain-containing [Hyphodiscus hymeniophilus]|uniref:SET and MYND domain-containing n=1 Tax=Hyphodiscus hymeniophilus TaxID=353542 RepID=A0A9P6VEX3_9HELO|nr:SET and MYND domain-containing [Hyphodiscus hymeniophilus]
MEQAASSSSISSPPSDGPNSSTPTIDASTSSSSKASQPEPKQCALCKSPAPPPNPNANDEEQAAEKGLKPCSKCHTALYCSRDCAKAAWKVHKKTCATDAQKYSLSVKEKPAVPRAPKKEGHRGGLQKWQFDT